MEWHFSRHAFCTLASSFIRNYSESKFSFSPARGHKNGPTTRRLRGTFLSSSIQFAYEKESAAALAVARTQGRCKSDAWWETFIMTASEWFYYWREINSGPRKLIPRKSVPTLSQPYDHIYPVLWRTGRMPCSFFFIWDTLVTHLSALSKSTLIRTRVFPWHRGGWGKKKGRKKENVYQEPDTIFTCSLKESLTLAPVVFLHLNSAQMDTFSHFSATTTHHTVRFHNSCHILQRGQR